MTWKLILNFLALFNDLRFESVLILHVFILILNLGFTFAKNCGFLSFVIFMIFKSWVIGFKRGLFNRIHRFRFAWFWPACFLTSLSACRQRNLSRRTAWSHMRAWMRHVRLRVLVFGVVAAILTHAAEPTSRLGLFILFIAAGASLFLLRNQVTWRGNAELVFSLVFLWNHRLIQNGGVISKGHFLRCFGTVIFDGLLVTSLGTRGIICVDGEA